MRLYSIQVEKLFHEFLKKKDISPDEISEISSHQADYHPDEIWYKITLKSGKEIKCYLNLICQEFKER
jgi:hypothetical protein